MRAIPGVVAAAVVLSVLVSWKWWGANEPPRTAAPTVATPTIDQTATQQAPELASLLARVATLERRVAALSPTDPASSAAAPCPSAPGLTQHITPQSVPTRTDEAPSLDLVDSFERLPASAAQPARAAELASRVHAALPRDASLDRLECRGEVCRMEVTVQGIERYREFLKRAFAEPNNRVWKGSTKLGFISEPDAQNWERDEISFFAYLGPLQAGQE